MFAFYDLETTGTSPAFDQPLQFAGEEPDPRTEDEIIAKTFANFLDGGDSQWPALLPII